MKPLKIALCGRGGTGKSTLASATSIRLGLPLISESIRTATRMMGLEGVRDLSLDQRKALQAVALAWQLGEEDKHSRSGFVSDRSVWDYVAYTKQLVSPEYADILRAMIPAEPRYSLLIHVPKFTDNIEDDGTRLIGDVWEPIETRVDWECNFRADCGLGTLALQERVAEVLALIKERTPE